MFLLIFMLILPLVLDLDHGLLLLTSTVRL
jgi:hypothetical protein